MAVIQYIAPRANLVHILCCTERGRIKWCNSYRTPASHPRKIILAAWKVSVDIIIIHRLWSVDCTVDWTVCPVQFRWAELSDVNVTLLYRRACNKRLWNPANYGRACNRLPIGLDEKWLKRKYNLIIDCVVDLVVIVQNTSLLQGIDGELTWQWIIMMLVYFLFRPNIIRKLQWQLVTRLNSSYRQLAKKHKYINGKKHTT